MSYDEPLLRRFDVPSLLSLYCVSRYYRTCLDHLYGGLTDHINTLIINGEWRPNINQTLRLDLVLRIDLVWHLEIEVEDITHNHPCEVAHNILLGHARRCTELGMVDYLHVLVCALRKTFKWKGWSPKGDCYLYTLIETAVKRGRRQVVDYLLKCETDRFPRKCRDEMIIRGGTTAVRMKNEAAHDYFAALLPP